MNGTPREIKAEIKRLDQEIRPCASLDNTRDELEQQYAALFGANRLAHGGRR